MAGQAPASSGFRARPGIGETNAVDVPKGPGAEPHAGLRSRWAAAPDLGLPLISVAALGGLFGGADWPTGLATGVIAAWGV